MDRGSKSHNSKTSTSSSFGNSGSRNISIFFETFPSLYIGGFNWLSCVHWWLRWCHKETSWLCSPPIHRITIGVGCLRMPTAPTMVGTIAWMQPLAELSHPCSWQSCASSLAMVIIPLLSSTKSWMFCKVLQIEDDKVSSGPAYEQRVFAKWTCVILDSPGDLHLQCSIRTNMLLTAYIVEAPI